MENQVQVMEPTALTAITEGEINMQIATAKKYPRSIAVFEQKALTLATRSQEIARQCYYKLKRGGKTIEGPSVRLAEICVNSWGNLRAGARIIAVEEKEIVSQGGCHDLETNSASTIEVRRRITNKDGVRYNDDMITMTGNAACAIAYRNACFKVVPYVYVQEILSKVKACAIGNLKTFEETKENCFKKFSDIKVSEKMILKYLSRQSEKDIDRGDLEDLLGVLTAIQDKETTVAEQFHDSKPEGIKKTTRRAEPEKKQEEPKQQEPQNEAPVQEEGRPEPTEDLHSAPLTAEEYKKECTTRLEKLLTFNIDANKVSAVIIDKGYPANPFLVNVEEYDDMLEVLDQMIRDKTK